MNDYTVNGSTVHTYFTSGWGGQAIYIIPEFDSVVVFTAGNYVNVQGMEKVQYFLETYILPSIL
jgi:CubicO group peptidase (beta-lactamase class C family)